MTFSWQVNNAGIGALSPVLECININYFGTVNLTEKLLPLFKESIGRARIINISSSAGILAVSHFD